MGRAVISECDDTLGLLRGVYGSSYEHPWSVCFACQGTAIACYIGYVIYRGVHVLAHVAIILSAGHIIYSGVFFAGSENQS
jgi:hypothetical protein